MVALTVLTGLCQVNVVALTVVEVEAAQSHVVGVAPGGQQVELVDDCSVKALHLTALTP